MCTINSFCSSIFTQYHTRRPLVLGSFPYHPLNMKSENSIRCLSQMGPRPKLPVEHIAQIHHLNQRSRPWVADMDLQWIYSSTAQSSLLKSLPRSMIPHAGLDHTSRKGTFESSWIGSQMMGRMPLPKSQACSLKMYVSNLMLRTWVNTNKSSY